MTEISLRLPVDPDDLAAELTGEMDHEELLRFVLNIEKYTADLDFTKKLVKKLNKVIKKEKDAEVPAVNHIPLNHNTNSIREWSFW